MVYNTESTTGNAPINAEAIDKPQMAIQFQSILYEQGCSSMSHIVQLFHVLYFYLDHCFALNGRTVSLNAKILFVFSAPSKRLSNKSNSIKKPFITK